MKGKLCFVPLAADKGKWFNGIASKQLEEVSSKPVICRLSDFFWTLPFVREVIFATPKEYGRKFEKYPRQFHAAL